LPSAAKGEFAQAQRTLENALRHTAEWVGDHDIYAAQVDIAARNESIKELQYFGPLSLGEASRLEHNLYLGISRRGLGVLNRLIGQFTHSYSELEKSLELFEGLGAKCQIGRTLVEQGKLAAEMNKNEEAINKLASAVEIFAKIQAKPDLDQTNKLISMLQDEDKGS
jgi:tetratricopeptide (TPR) repeat protein